MEKGNIVKKILIFILAFTGFITTIKLAMIYYDANFNAYALPSFCNINDFIDCDGIAQTTESQFLGIPLAYWGMFFYLFVIVLLIADKLKKFILFRFLEVFKNPLDYIALLGIFSFCVSMILLCVSLFEINKLCILCAFTYVLNLLIGLIALDYKNGGIIKAIKQSIADFLDAIKNKVYLAAFIAVIFVAGGALAYTERTDIFAPQVKQQKEYKKLMKFKNSAADINGNVLGDPDGTVIVYVYTDYNCPYCGAFDAMVRKSVSELNNVKVVHKNLPLDMECNKFLKNPFHEGSCKLARFAMAAEKQGKFWDINSKFFELQPQTETEIASIAKKLKLDIDKLFTDAESPEIKDQLAKDIETAYNSQINATPSMVVNGKIHVGIKPYPEMIKILEEAGATRK